MTMHGKEDLPMDPQEENSLIKLKAIGELKKTVTPETVTNYWRNRLEVDGIGTGPKIVVPDYPLTQTEFIKPMKRRVREGIIGRVAGQMVYLPQELTGPEGLIRLGKMYGDLLKGRAKGSYTLEEKPEVQVTDTHNTFGWIKVEATNRAPNTYTTEKDLRDFAKNEGYFLQREVVYVLASMMFHDLKLEFFDQAGKTWSRLGGSHGGGGVIAACFYPDGYLRVLLAVDPKQHDDQLGGRFEEPLRR